jgi:hypothetical protein
MVVLSSSWPGLAEPDSFRRFDLDSFFMQEHDYCPGIYLFPHYSTAVKAVLWRAPCD